MQESFTICPRCEGNACHEISNDKLIVWSCFGCVILEDKSLVFADGKTSEEWKWAGVQSKDGKADMTTVKYFEEKEFMEALDYIGFFEKQK